MIATINDLPVYNAEISDEECGMMKISLVDSPAVMSDFLAFANQAPRLLYSIQDQDRRLVRGVVMRADFPIYREDPVRGSFYIIYTAATIRQMAEKYLAEGRQNDVNLMHAQDTDGVRMVQYFIKDSAAGVCPAGYEDIADGSLFAEFHIVNDDVWANVKAGTFRGFSLEGVFDLQAAQDQAGLDTIAQDLDGRFSNIPNHKQTKMSNIKQKIKTALAKLLAEFGAITTDKGILAYDGDVLEVGTQVFIEDAEGHRSDAEDGDYTAEDGTIYKVEAGVVTEIVEAQVEETTETTEEVEAEEEAEEVEVDVEALQAENAALKAENEALKAEIAALKGEVAKDEAELRKFKKMSAAKAAHQEVVVKQKAVETGDKRLDNLARILSASKR